MKFRDWRVTQKIRVIDMARSLGFGGKNPGRRLWRYERGEAMPDAILIEKIRQMTNGNVTADDWHYTRLEFMRRHGDELPPQIMFTSG